MKNIKWTILIAVAVLVLVSPCVNGEFFTDPKDTLRGIEGVIVCIEELDPELKSSGLLKNVIKTDVELKLRMAGIKVYSESEWDKLPRRESNILHVMQAGVKSSKLKNVLAYAIEVSFEQPVILEKNQNVSCYATTWFKNIVMISGIDHVEETYRKALKILVDQFLNDYLAVNPKQVDKPKKM